MTRHTSSRENLYRIRRLISTPGHKWLLLAIILPLWLASDTLLVRSQSDTPAAEDETAAEEPREAIDTYWQVGAYAPLPAGQYPFLSSLPFINTYDSPVHVNSFFDHRFPIYGAEQTAVVPDDLRDTSGAITSIFTGEERTAGGQGYSWYSGHTGFDYSGRGTEPLTILAPADGRIARGREARYGYCSVWIEHDASLPPDNVPDYATYYLHLASVADAPPEQRSRPGRNTEGCGDQWCMGDTIAEGESIGTEGDDDCGGNADGVHLHFEVAIGEVIGRTNARRIDPFGWWSSAADPWASPRVANGQTSHWLWAAPVNPGPNSGQYWGDNIVAQTDDLDVSFHRFTPQPRETSWQSYQSSDVTEARPIGSGTAWSPSLASGENRKSFAVWALHVPQDSSYRVQVHIPSHPASIPAPTTNAIYEVRIPQVGQTLSSWRSQAINQQQTGWITLMNEQGSDTFAALGNTVILILLNDLTGMSGESVLFDAVRLEQTGEATPQEPLITRRVGFVVDNTSSMQAAGKIDALRRSIPVWISDLEAESVNYVYSLIPFAENVPVVQTTTDAAQIQTTIAQLSANDNGLSNTDCPEASLQAVSSIAPSIQGGDILLFTDDLPKDPVLWSSQSFLALQRAQAKLHSIILPKTCGRSSPADWLPYRSLSLISGGSYQSVTTDKTEAALQIVLSEMRANTDLGPSPQSIVHTKTNGVVQTATAEVYEVVVDDTVSEANFLLNVLEGSFTLTLFDPAGHLIDAMAPTVQLIDSGSAQYYTITDPQPGIWRAQILGDGDFVFRSSADSLIEYTYLGETYASPGKMMQLVARVTGPISRVSFEVENTNGTVVDSVQLKDNGTLGDFSAGDGVYTGFYTPTTTADLQMRVIGETEAGTAFLRGDPRLIRVRSLSIEAPPAIDVTTDGTYRLDFSIQNTGSQAETYELESLAQYVTIEQGPPQFITVQPQSSVIVPVTIYIPPDGLPNGSDAVRVTAVAQHDQTLIAEGATAVFVPEKETSPFSNIYLPVIRSPSACDTGNSPPVDVIFVLDRSGSMLEDNRFEEAKNALRTFINQMDFSREQAGLVSFSSDARLEQMLTNDRDALNSAISRLEVDGPTAIGDGIAAAMSELQSSRHRPTHQSVMIVLSDGQNNMGQEPLPIATAAKSAGIRIFTIALGGSADTGLLQQIASSPTDFYAAPNASNLDAIYQTIAGVVRCVTQTVVNTHHS